MDFNICIKGGSVFLKYHSFKFSFADFQEQWPEYWMSFVDKVKENLRERDKPIKFVISKEGDYYHEWVVENSNLYITFKDTCGFFEINKRIYLTEKMVDTIKDFVESQDFCGTFI